MRIGIVCSEFHFDITQAMLKRAKEHAKFLETEVATTVLTPGVFEIALAARKLLVEKSIDGVVALGAVIEGETEHDTVIAQHAVRKLIDLSLEFGKPVGLGISGPGMTRIQAEERIDRAKQAVESVVKMWKRVK